MNRYTSSLPAPTTHTAPPASQTFQGEHSFSGIRGSVASVPSRTMSKDMHAAGYSTPFPVNEPGPLVPALSTPYMFSTAYSLRR